MKTITEIQQAILELPESEYAKLSRWFQERDWEQWDEDIAEDSRAGRLDHLVDQANKAKADGTLREL